MNKKHNLINYRLKRKNKMNDYTLGLYHRAMMAKRRLAFGQLTLEEAKENAKPYIDYVNIASKEKAKEFGVRARLVNVSSFLR